jgi:alpha-1,6-mannosyltransferase
MSALADARAVPTPTPRRRVADLAVAAWSRPAVAVGLGVVGLSVYVVGESHLLAVRRNHPLWDWGGLAARVTSTDLGWLILAAAVALALWLAAWWQLVQRARSGRLGNGSLTAAAVGWSVPLLAGPPLLSMDVYSYIAQGRLLDLGRDPYRVGPIALHNAPIVAAVDPLWRRTPSPYGPLALRAQGVAVHLAGSHPVVTIFLLRALLLVAVLAVTVLVLRTLPRRERPVAVLLGPLNPVLLVTLFSGAHLDGLMAAGVALGLLAARAGKPRLALFIAGVSVGFKMPAVVLAAALLVADLRPLRGWVRARRAATDLAALGVGVAGASLTVPDGLGWLRTLGSPGKVGSGYAPAQLAAHLLHGVLRLAGYAGGWQTELGVMRASAMLLGALAVGYLCLTVHRRGVTRTTVLGLLVVVAGAPVFYDWYLVWVLVPALVLVASRRARRGMVALTSIGVVALVPDFHVLTVGQRQLLAAAVLVPAFAVGVHWLVEQRRNRRRAVAARPTGWRRRVPQVSAAGLVVGVLIATTSGPAVALPAKVRQTAEHLSGGSAIRHAWDYGGNFYVLQMQPGTAAEQPLVLSGDGKLVAACSLLRAEDARRVPVLDQKMQLLPPQQAGAPVLVYKGSDQACWAPTPQGSTD